MSAPKLYPDDLFICSHDQLSHCTLMANHLSKLMPCYTLPDVRNHVLIDVISSPLTQFTMLKSLEVSGIIDAQVIFEFMSKY